jgi:CubicO group peptidase (beta-lactamase class C family)
VPEMSFPTRGAGRAVSHRGAAPVTAPRVTASRVADSRARTSGAARAAAVLFVLASLVAPLGRPALAQPAAGAAAPDSATLAARTDQVFADLARPGSPGCALAVYRGGRIAYTRGYGLANLELSVPITPRTVFDIGSTSKQFTAMSILLLARDGKLSLDDPVQKHVPEVPAYGRPVTIRHLLHHTSGMRDYIELMSLAGAREEDLTDAKDALTVISRQRVLNFEPGSEWLYSNTGYFLLGVVVERASGKPLPAFAHERIFAPLDMNSTHYHDDHTMVVPNRATGYAPRDPAKGGGFSIAMSDWEQTGDGAVMTTVEDLLRWDENFYTGQVGGRALLDSMQRTATLNGGKPLTYAAGLFVDRYRGLRAVSHGGAWAGYRAELLRFPDQHLSVACLCNLATARPTQRARQVADVQLAGQFPAEQPKAVAARQESRQPIPPALSERELAALAGTYRDPVGGDVYRVAARDGHLAVEMSGDTYPLVRTRGREFRVDSAPYQTVVAFESAGGGAQRLLRIMPEGRPPSVAEAIAVVTPSAAQLAGYAGTYFSEELQTTLAIAVDSGALVLRGRNLPSEALRPLREDEFSVGYYTLHFDRGADRRVSGFTLDLGRIRNLKFVRRV